MTSLNTNNLFLTTIKHINWEGASNRERKKRHPSPQQRTYPPRLRTPSRTIKHNTDVTSKSWIKEDESSFFNTLAKRCCCGHARSLVGSLHLFLGDIKRRAKIKTHTHTQLQASPAAFFVSIRDALPTVFTQKKSCLGNQSHYPASCRLWKCPLARHLPPASRPCGCAAMKASKPWLTSTELVLSLGLASPLSTSPDPAWPSLIPKPKP